MKTVKLVVAFILTFAIGLMVGFNWSKFGSSKDSHNTATSEKAVAVTAEANPFLNCITRAEQSVRENSIGVIVANGNLMSSMDSIDENSTKSDFETLKSRDDDRQKAEDLAILKNGEIATSCSNWGQLPEELAAN